MGAGAIVTRAITPRLDGDERAPSHDPRRVPTETRTDLTSAISRDECAAKNKRVRARSNAYAPRATPGVGGSPGVDSPRVGCYGIPPLPDPRGPAPGGPS